MNEIVIYGEIGVENTARGVREQLETFDGADVTVRVNSPGGNFYEGIAIMNVLRNYQGKVTVVIEALAASAASFIAVGGGDYIIARPNAEVMIHDASNVCGGNAADFQRAAEDLDRISDSMAKIYAEKAGGDWQAWREIMRGEQWYTAEEALEAGLVDAVDDARVPAVAAAAVPLAFADSRRHFRYLGRGSAPAPRPVNDMPHRGQKGEEKMTFLAQLAQTMGMKEDEVRAGIASIRAEEVQVNLPVTITYPDEATIVPTGKTEVDPDTPLPEGAEVAAEIGEGFTCEVDPTGVVFVHASDEVSVGDVADLIITVGDQTATVKITVVAADEEVEPTEPTEAEPPVETEEPVGETTEKVPMRVVPESFYQELVAAYQLNGQRMEELAQQKREATVDEWIADGRFPAAKRAEVVALMKRDPELATNTWGSLEKGSIPRAEKGYGVDPEAPSTTRGAAKRSPFPSVRI